MKTTEETSQINLSNDERINLKKLISQSDCEDNTEYIRKIKHSVKIRDDIRQMDKIKKQNVDLKTEDPEKYIELLKTKCSFLFNNYTDIFNRILKDELDLGIMTKLLTVLKLIEDKKIDQHEGSVHVGKILKELYIDSAMKEAEHLDLKNKKVEPFSGKEIDWKDFKKMKNL